MSISTLSSLERIVIGMEGRYDTIRDEQEDGSCRVRREEKFKYS